MLRALYHDAAAIQVVELNPRVLSLFTREYADYTGNLLGAAEVSTLVGDVRGFLARSDDTFDLIELGPGGGFGAAGLYTLNEDYLHTVEALELFLSRLRQGGVLAVTSWAKVPPRDSLKLFATAVEALRRAGHSNPGDSLALIRGWQTSTLIANKGKFDAAEIAELLSFCEALGLDVAYYPGISAEDANRHNILTAPVFYEGATALLGPDAATFLRNYKFDLSPATDQRPYFYNFFKWSTLAEILDARGRGGMALIEAGYLVLVVTLVQAVLISLGLIVLPLGWMPEPRAGAALTTLAAVASIGFAFMFIEIAYIQRLTLLLSHPIYSIAISLTVFLVFAGLGSITSGRLAGRGPTGTALSRILLALLLIGCIELAALSWAIDAAQGWALAARLATSILLTAPLAFLMGMPFPVVLSATREHVIPWAWAVNGCASVTGAVLAALLTVHFGSTLVIAFGIGLYGICWLIWSAENRQRAPGTVS